MSSHLVPISLIVPVYNNASDLLKCIAALKIAKPPHSEIIIVNDGSTDETGVVADRLLVKVIHRSENAGGAAARNLGARNAQGMILFFVDSDVVVNPDTIDRVTQFFYEFPEISAVFGSYNAKPYADGFISQYRNLLHHYFHQCGNSEASTFWAGCGAIRHSVFEKVGGFNENFATNLEDVELGYRLKRAGCRIRLDKTLQVTHLKRWTFVSMLKADIISRALPWSRLILETREFPNDLNVDVRQRASVILVMIGLAFLVSGVFWVPLLLISAATISIVLTLNRSLLTFLYKQRGLSFACGCIPLYLLYYVYSGASFFVAWVEWLVMKRNTGLVTESLEK